MCQLQWVHMLVCRLLQCLYVGGDVLVVDGPAAVACMLVVEWVELLLLR